MEMTDAEFIGLLASFGGDQVNIKGYVCELIQLQSAVWVLYCPELPHIKPMYGPEIDELVSTMHKELGD